VGEIVLVYVVVAVAMGESVKVGETVLDNVVVGVKVEVEVNV
jgi:hypothetical protein